MPMSLDMISWATAPEEATMRPETVPRMVAKAMADMRAKMTSPMDLARRGAAMLLLSTSMTPDVMAPNPMKRVRT
jgi:hypothetical protein